MLGLIFHKLADILLKDPIAITHRGHGFYVSILGTFSQLSFPFPWLFWPNRRIPWVRCCVENSQLGQYRQLISASEIWEF